MNDEDRDRKIIEMCADVKHVKGDVTEIKAQMTRREVICLEHEKALAKQNGRLTAIERSFGRHEDSHLGVGMQPPSGSTNGRGGKLKTTALWGGLITIATLLAQGLLKAMEAIETLVRGAGP